jgi:hypothetical protein
MPIVPAYLAENFVISDFLSRLGVRVSSLIVRPSLLPFPTAR